MLTDDDTERSEPDGCECTHTGQSMDGGSPTEGQHAADNHIGSHCKEEKDQMSCRAPSDLDDFEESVCIWSIDLEFRGVLSKEQDL